MAPPPEAPPDPYRPAYDISTIDVEPQSLDQFANFVAGDRGALLDAWNRAKADIENGPSPNFPGRYPREFHYGNGYPELAYQGDDGIQEGQAFYRAYFMTVGAELSLMTDMLKGLQVLEQAARMIHNDYIDRDSSNAANLEGAFAAYERSSVLHALGEATDDIDGGTAQ